MKRTLYAVMLVLFCTAPLHAQEFNMSLNAQLLLPQSEFKQSIDALGGGIQFNGLYRFRNSPFGLGLDLSISNFGIDKRDEPLSSTIPDLRVEVQNQYNLGQFLLLGRVQPPDGVFRPYAEGLVGFNYFFTETTIRNRNDAGAEPIASDTNFEDLAFAWGGGTGVMIRLYDQRGKEMPVAPDGSATIPSTGYLTFGVRYLIGNEAEYLKEGSIQITNSTVTYDVFRSKTDMMVVQLGFLIRF